MPETMSTTLTSVDHKKIVADVWEITTEEKNGPFSADFVVDAYLKGQEDLIRQAGEFLVETFEKNTKRTTQLTKEVLSYLEKNKIEPVSAFIKFVSWKSLQVLIVLSEKDFLSPDTLRAYDVVSDIELRENDSSYDVCISFIGSGESLNEDRIKADGFIGNYLNL